MPDPAAQLASHRCAPGAQAHVQPAVLPSHSLLLLAQQRIERYLRLQELGVRECSYEMPLVEEEIALLEEEVLPVIAHFLERSDAIAAAREAWPEQQVKAEEFELEPALPVGAVG